MSEFEVFSVVLSFILGLGVAQILAAIASMIRARREITFSWIPFAWAFVFLLFHINFLFSSLWFYSVTRTFTWYLVDIVAAILLFLSGGLILPSESRPLPSRLDRFFEDDGRIALLPLFVFLALAIPYNVQGGVPLLGLDNLIIVLLLGLAVIAFARGGRARSMATAACTALVTLAFLFLWARPGA